jgi:hypothetical protein
VFDQIAADPLDRFCSVDGFNWRTSDGGRPVELFEQPRSAFKYPKARGGLGRLDLAQRPLLSSRGVTTSS